MQKVEVCEFGAATGREMCPSLECNNVSACICECACVCVRARGGSDTHNGPGCFTSTSGNEGKGCLEQSRRRAKEQNQE